MKRVLRWAALTAGGVVGLLLVAVGAMYLLGTSRVNRTYLVETADLLIPSDSASLAHGAYLARIHGCTDCHTQDLSGQVLLDIPPFRATAANLTRGRGGIGATYSAEDLDRAIRHGVKPSGKPVIVMPSAAFHQISDEDAADLIAYLQSLPPVDKVLPPTVIRVPGRIMAAAVFDPAVEVRPGPTRAGGPPPQGPTPEYGAYLTSITCAYCHGEDLRGNAKPPIQGSPPAPDLVAAAARWPLPAFKRTLQTGVTPEGKELNAEFMPWTLTAAMTEEDLEAIYAQLSSRSTRKP